MSKSEHNVGRGIAILIAIIMGALVIAFTIPIIIDGESNTHEESFEMEEGETIVVSSSLSATLNVVNSGSDDINVTVFSTEDASADSTDGLVEGNSVDLTVSGQTITVTNVLVVSGNTAIVDFEYPVTFAWGTPTTVIYGAIGMLLIVMLLIYVIGGGFSIFEGGKR